MSHPQPPHTPPGVWRVLAPALTTWALVALAIALPGSWRALVVLGAGFGVVAAWAMWRGRGASRQCRPVTVPGVSRGPAPMHIALISYGSVLAALLLVTGARIGVAEGHRTSPVLDAALESGERVDVRVRLDDFPTLPGPPRELEHPDASHADTATRPIAGWVPATLIGSQQPTPVVLWFQEATPFDPGPPRDPGTAGIDPGTAGFDPGTAARRLQHSPSGSPPPPALWAPGTEVRIRGAPVPLGPTSSAAYGLSVTEFATIDAAPGPARLAAGLRAELRATAANLPGAALVPGFAVGDTALVSEQLDADMRASSLTHLVAVSGANCALVTSAAIWALSWLGLGRRLRAVAAGLALAGFVVVVGPDVSVQRAAIMGAVLLASSFGGKRSVALPALGIAIAVLLLLDPWQSWQPGFALSVAATAGIVLCAPVFTEVLRRVVRLPTVVALPVAVAAAAQFACGPFLLLLQDGIPAAGLLANVLAGPAAPAGTALGLAALIAGPFAGGLAQALLVAASVPARWVEETARVASSLPGARWEWLSGLPGALLLAAVDAAAVLAWLLASGRLTEHGSRVRRPWLPDTRGPRWLQLWVAILWGAVAGVFIGPTLVAPTVERAGVPTDWRIVACDVGQGDAILLRGPNARPGEAMLVDTGDDETLLRDCLRLFGVRRIPLLVLTHDDRDHVGAIAAAAPMTEAAIVAPASSSQVEAGQGQAPDRPLIAQLDAFGIPWQIGGAADTRRHDATNRAGDSNGAGTAASSGEAAGVTWKLLAPDPLVTPVTTNDASLVMRAEAGGLSALLLGDTGEESQHRLLNAVRDTAEEALLQADVVKVAHHGSRDQHPRMYGIVGARVGLVSVGDGNGYGHPAGDTIDALVDADTRPLRTDELGAIALFVDGRPDEGRHGEAPRVWAQRGRVVGGDQ